MRLFWLSEWIKEDRLRLSLGCAQLGKTSRILEEPGVLIFDLADGEASSRAVVERERPAVYDADGSHQHTARQQQGIDVESVTIA